MVTIAFRYIRHGISSQSLVMVLISDMAWDENASVTSLEEST